MQATKDLIEKFIRVSNNNLKRANSTFTSLSPHQLNWKPGVEIWSVGECISHLVVTNKLYYNKICKLTIERSSNLMRDLKYSQSFLGKLLAKAVNPQNVKNTKTFKVFNPSASLNQKTTLEEYILILQKFMEFAESLDGVDLKIIKFSSPLSKMIRFNLGDPFIFIPMHDERHLNQAEKIIYLTEFPKE